MSVFFIKFVNTTSISIFDVKQQSTTIQHQTKCDILHYFSF